ncbi:MAG: hypothetical protein KKA68_21285 [Gammaproteobacteria bacterium]|nr:hypothetical protein [Gammaproteobacteria bacterium]
MPESPTDVQSEMDSEAARAQLPPKTDSEIRRRFQSRIRSRILDGIAANLRAARPNQAVDMAWDATPIQRQTIPLLMWGQGKIKIEPLYRSLCGTLGTAQADKFFNKKTVNGQTVIDGVNVDRITDIQIDLMKSYVTRRHAAMDALWSNLWPLYRYDPRGTDDVSMLRADALTQRVDIISDSYNYRHLDSQCRRHMLLYGRSATFPQEAWNVKTNWRFKRGNTGEPTEETESYVKQEGIIFVNPHPSRIYSDLSSPMANINSDTGPSFIGYWDVVRWGSLLEPDAPYFNLKDVFLTDGWTGLADKYTDFMGHYFDSCVLSWPQASGGTDPSLGNDREVNIGRYSTTARDVGVLRTHHFERINPKQEGIGEYDADVWIHFTVAGDCTIIGAEFMPSFPCAYGAINWDDGRLANQSMGMALLAYQDQASNILSSMIMQLRTSLIQLWLLDKDSLEPEILQEFKNNASDSNWWVDRKLLIYSATKLRDLGIQDPAQAFKVVQAPIANVFDSGLKALNQLLNLADRLLILSPNELGQPNPREVSAREVTDISTSVQSMYAFINQGPREQIAAKKEIIYDSLLCCGQQNIRVPVEKRYTKAVIEKAGFTIPEDVQLPPGAGDIIPVKTPVMGNLRSLMYDYYFDSRDGSERVVNTQGAQVVQQLLARLLNVPPLAEKMGIKAIMDMANTIIRMSGAPTNFQFDLPVGSPDELSLEEKKDPAIQGLQQEVQQIKQLLMQLTGAGAPVAPPGAQGQQPQQNLLQEPPGIAA